MQVEDGVTIEADLSGLLDQELDRLLVVQNHLRLQGILAFGGLSQCEETFCLEQRIGIALQSTRIPGQVNQQPVKDLPRIGAGGAWPIWRSAQVEQTLPGCRWKGAGRGWAVRIKEAGGG